MYQNGRRAMAWVVAIDAVEKHPNADALDICTIGGWRCVTKLNEYVPGDLAVYCSIDSFIPHDLAPFLSNGSQPREYHGVLGNRLRTVKLRGQVSQGLLLPLSSATQFTEAPLQAGDDVSELLNIQKYEPPVPAQLAGEARGVFPSFIQKTDQERLQNLAHGEESVWSIQPSTWEVTEKLDGASMTVYVCRDDQGVCSRNYNLRETQGNSLWETARRLCLLEKLATTGRELALQGELIGHGVQGNPYKISGHDFRVFDIFDIDSGQYLLPHERTQLCEQLEITHVPVLYTADHLLPMWELLKSAEGKSQLFSKAEREGLVYKHAHKQVSFKAISNRFLLKTKN